MLRRAPEMRRQIAREGWWNAAGVRVPRQELQTASLLDKTRPRAEWGAT